MEDEGPTFESTPSWVIGAVVFVIVGVSLAIDKLLSKLGNFLKKRDKKPLYEALQKTKEELMLMGFVSLLLAFVQDKVQHWCVPEKFVDDWLPCHSTDDLRSLSSASLLSSYRRRLLGDDDDPPPFTCKEGKVPFIGLGVLHDLHYLIFILAVVHVFSCTLTVLLGEAKISQWRKWEESIKEKMVQPGESGAAKVIYIRELTFVKDRYDSHAKFTGLKNYVNSFFKHLLGVVTKGDFEAMRLGFILAHCQGNQDFHFLTYMVYAYEGDFKNVVTIRWFLWLFAVVSLTLHVAGWNIYFWISLIPIFFLLIVGTKLQEVITDLISDFAQRHIAIFEGETQIQPSDDYFWFKRPKLILHCIHIILFINSFGFAIFFWTLFKFGFESCIMGDPKFAIGRLVLMVAVQTILSYSTLPLYAIVTQMGTSHNKAAMKKAYEAAEGGTHGSLHSATSGSTNNWRREEDDDE